MKRSISPALILTLLAGIAQAASPIVPFGDWSSGLTGDRKSFNAVTLNDAHEALGEFCFFDSQQCTWQFNLQLTCRENENFWLLANTDSGYLPLQAKCLGFNTFTNGYDYVFISWKDAEKILKDRTNNVVAFAMPIGGTQFRVIRFSLRGVNEATAYAEEQFKASAAQSKKQAAPVSDQTL